MEMFLYMMSKNILTYALFKGTRGALNAGMGYVENSMQIETLWHCPRCYQRWQGKGDELGEDACPFCDTKLKQVNNLPKYGEHRYDRNEYGDRRDSGRTAA